MNTFRHSKLLVNLNGITYETSKSKEIIEKVSSEILKAKEEHSFSYVEIAQLVMDLINLFLVIWHWH